MKKYILTIIVFGLFIFQLLSQTNQGTGLDQMIIRLKIWEESKPAYDKFIKKQAKIRQKLDKFIEKEDLAEVAILKNAYAEKMREMDARTQLLNTLIEDNEVLNIAKRTSAILNHRYQHMVASHSEITVPMLMNDEELYKIAEKLSKKYHAQIAKFDKKIQRKYKIFKKSEQKIRLKYINLEEKYQPEKKQVKRKYETNVYTDAKILITDAQI